MMRWEGPIGHLRGTGFWCVHLKERDHLEDLGVGGRIILKHTLKKDDKMMCVGFIRLARETSGEI
jgi:hypothetical protein